MEIWRDKGAPPPDLVAVLSYDEKPGMQAIENTAPDLPPVPGTLYRRARSWVHPAWNAILLTGIDLLSGEILGSVRKRHRSRELVLTQPDWVVLRQMAKTLLRGIRVASADELQARIELYLKEVNETHVVFRGKHKLETLSMV